jgi:hypothetical protein
MKMLIE